MIIVRRNRSIKPLPANWRELLEAAVTSTCKSPPKNFGSTVINGVRTIELPRAEIPPGSSPDLMVFVLNEDAARAALQRRAIDLTLTHCDVKTWPVPKITSQRTKNGELYITTSLPLHDRLSRVLFSEAFHSFDRMRIGTRYDIRWNHLEQYTAHVGKGKYLGIKTVCLGACGCQSTLPKYWGLGWEMHY
jgi:hypothetical protein